MTYFGNSQFSTERRLIRQHGGIVHMSDALHLGINRKALYAMRNTGYLTQLSRGIYRLTELPQLKEPDLVTVAIRAPSAVICLVSALAYHDLTTQVPHTVDIAIERGKNTPKIDYPPVCIYKMSKHVFHEGIELHKINKVSVRIYDPEKTIADCFKFRNQLGMHVVLEALKFWHNRRSRNTEKLLQYSHSCRVETVIRPYLEALQ